MLENYRLYKKGNYTIQKSINLDNELYTKLKHIVDYEYDVSMSELVNICIEKMLSKCNIKYYAKPEGEISIYRSIMIRKDNVEKLKEIHNKTGISVTRLINLAIKEFIDEYDNK